MFTPDGLKSLLSALVESHEINFAFASLLLYDYTICFGEEVEYFWTGPWSLSRILYLAIYEPWFRIVLSQRTKPVQPTSSTGTILLVKLFIFVIPISVLCQSVITLRIWYLFSRSPAVRIFAIAILIATVVASTLVVALQWNTIEYGVLHPQLDSSSSFAWIYVPSLLSHSLLFTLKVYRFFTSSVRLQTDSLLWGFVKEGMFMYVFAMASLVFGVVGLAMVEPSQLSVRMPAAIASPIVAAVVVSVCRVMLSIHSVAATAHVDPEWLLNHAELSRVRWRRGNVDGEILVEAGEFTVFPDVKCSRDRHDYPLRRIGIA